MKVVFWDFDGTLAWREGKWTGTMTKLAMEMHPELGIERDALRPHMTHGYPWHSPEIAHPGQSADEWWETLYPVMANAYLAAGANQEQASEMALMMREVYIDLREWRVFPDSIPCLQELRNHGWKHYILSNHVPELPEIVDALGLTGYFQKIITSAATGYEKPNPEAYKVLLNEIPPDAAVWMIGDNVKADVLGAEAVGLKAILVREDSPDARLRCDSLDEVPSILRADSE